MRRTVLALTILILAATFGFAQGEGSEQVLRRLGLTDDQISQLIAVQEKTRADIQKAQAEIDAAKAQLAILLQDPNADPKEVERLVRITTDGDAKIKLARIQREQEVRRIVGERRWRRLMLILRLRQDRQEMRRGEPQD